MGSPVVKWSYLFKLNPFLCQDEKDIPFHQDVHGFETIHHTRFGAYGKGAFHELVMKQCPVVTGTVKKRKRDNDFPGFVNNCVTQNNNNIKYIEENPTKTSLWHEP